MKVVYAERAKADIAHIYERIALNNPPAAQRIEAMIRNTCEGLGLFPYASAQTDEANVRRVPLVRYPYTIFFRIDDAADRVEIAGVVHGARVKSLGKLPD